MKEAVSAARQDRAAHRVCVDRSLRQRCAHTRQGFAQTCLCDAGPNCVRSSYSSHVETTDDNPARLVLVGTVAENRAGRGRA